MYKRIPASRFDSLSDVFFCMIDFMQECGFTVVSNNAKHLFYNVSNLSECYVLYDSYANHSLCLVYYNELDSSNYENIALFVFDSYDDTKTIDEQEHPSKLGSESYWKWAIAGVPLNFKLLDKDRINISDLVCVYTNKSLIFIYVPTSCYIYSHIYNYMYTSGGGIMFYGNFTKYHLEYRKDTVLCFSNYPYTIFQLDMDDNYKLSIIDIGMGAISSMVFCSPEASNTRGENCWFVGSTPVSTYSRIPPKDPSIIATSFGLRVADGGIFSAPDYTDFYLNTEAREKCLLGSTLNNTSVLMPLIVYGMREPHVLNNWSAIGESRLINLIDMSHISSGEMFIDNGVNKDLHRYFVFPSLHDKQSIEFEEDKKDGIDYGEYKYEKGKYSFTGIAVEIFTEEDIFKGQSDDGFIVELADSYRNYDKLVVTWICYGCGKTFSRDFSFEYLEENFNSSGIINMSRPGHPKFSVYGMQHPDIHSTEYTFMVKDDGSNRHKVVSVIGYRE